MDSAEAREHIEMVDRILAASSSRLTVGGELFLVWGLASAMLSSAYQLVIDRLVPESALWAIPAVYAVAIGITIFRQQAYRRCCEGPSLLQREFLTVLWLTLTMALVACLVGFHFFTAWGLSAIWSLAATVVLFYIAVHGNRRAMAGGIIVLASVAGANFMPPPVAGYVLGSGMLFGYAGFGLAELLARD